MLNSRQNYQETITFGRPDWIPAAVSLSQAVVQQYPKETEALAADYPQFIARAQQQPPSPAQLTDAWGCVWEFPVPGLEGIVVGHPLQDWADLDDYTVPDPLLTDDRGPVDWERRRLRVAENKAEGRWTSGSLPHGFLFLRLTYLRGFTETVCDMMDDEPKLHTLLDAVNSHNRKRVQCWLDSGVDSLQLPEDLGTQDSPLIGPDLFRRWLVPAYGELVELCRERGVYTVFHSDGYILPLLDDLIRLGIDVINPQDLCNGIKELARYKGKVAIRLDIDRQRIVPYGTRQEIFELIEEEVRTLGSPQGGLELLAGIYPPTPPDNIRALCEAMAKYQRYWWES